MLRVLQMHNSHPQHHLHDKENLSERRQLAQRKGHSEVNPEEVKQKSELCKKFIEFGFCPFRERCRFAHGSHQLLSNRQANMKYKTKECQNFKNRYFCPYGRRCNFIHTESPPSFKVQPGKADIEMKIISRMSQKGSCLLTLLSPQL